MWREPGLRQLGLKHEHLIDVDEWCEVRRVAHGLPAPAALTSRLLDAIERIPFRMLGTTSELERGEAILRRAATVLARLDALRAHAPDGCCVVAFSARIGPCAHDAWHTLKLHCGPAEDGKPWIVIGMQDEIECTCDASWSGFVRTPRASILPFTRGAATRPATSSTTPSETAVPMAR